MKECKDFIEAYDNAYREMADKAVEVLKRSTEIDVVKILEAQCEEEGDDIDEQDFADLLSYSTYSCYLEGRHGVIYPVDILRVRYNRSHSCEEALLNIDVYLKSADGYIDDWYSIGYIVGGESFVYRTILEYGEKG